MKYINLWYILFIKLRRRVNPELTDKKLSFLASYALLMQGILLVAYIVIILSKYLTVLKEDTVFSFTLLGLGLLLYFFIYYIYERKDNWKKIEYNIDSSMTRLEKDKFFFWMTFFYLLFFFFLTITICYLISR